MKITGQQGTPPSSTAMTNPTPAGGDLDGTLPEPTVVGIGGVPISGLPSDGDTIVYDVTTNTYVFEAGGGGGGAFVGNDITPPHTVPVPAWVKPTGSGVITADPQGRITVDSGSGYKAFPGLAFLEGRLHLVYREGTGHISTGGVIKYRYSDNLGRTWSSATTIASSGGTLDYRDPTIAALSTGRLLLTYFTHDGSDALDVLVKYSDNRGQSWSSEYTIPDTFSGEVAGSGRPIELPDGSVLVPGYGESGSTWLAVHWKSTDGGLTFPTQTTVASSGSRDYYEPQMQVLASGKIVALLRTSTPFHTWRTQSTDGGATWSAATDVLTAGEGRPDFVEFYPGALLLFNREASGDEDGVWTVSWDEGLTWSALQLIDTTEDFEYAAPVVLAPGYVVVVYAVNVSASDADLYLRYYFDGYGTDPLGQIRAKWLQVDEQSAPATPPSGKGVFYAGTDGLPYFKDDAGTAYDLSGGNTLPPGSHAHVLNVVFSGDGATTAWVLPAAPVDATSVAAYIAGVRTQDWTLSGALLDTITFGSAPASAADNIVIDITAAVA